MPPSNNHFKPIHSRNASTDIKDALKKPDSATDSASRTPTNVFNNIDTKSASSFFDQSIPNKNTFNPLLPVQTETPSATVEAARNKLENLSTKLTSPSIFAPIPTKPITSSLFTPTNLPQLGPKTSLGLSNVPPPVSTLPSTFPPPVTNIPSIPPLLTQSPSIPPPITGPTLSNPYSAKGALNKKVYDTGIPVAQPITTPSAFLVPQMTVPEKPSIDLFVPPTNPTESQLPDSNNLSNNIQSSVSTIPSIPSPPMFNQQQSYSANQTYQQDVNQTQSFSTNQYQTPV